MVSSASRILFAALLAGGAVSVSAAHSKPASVEALDAVFQIGTSGTIEASINPPIQGVLRIVVRNSATAGTRHSQNERQPLTLEVTQWDRTVPFRLISQGGHYHPFGGRPSLLIAEIDVNDLTPGVPVRICVHSNLAAESGSAPPDLEARAYVVVY